MIARTLAGAWRSTPEPVTIDAVQLTAITPLLNGSGAAALGWWRVQASPHLAGRPEAEALHNAARMLAIRDSLRQRALAPLIAVLNEVGIVPLLFKGWAAARHYAETYLRPYGDFDLLVGPADLAAAAAALRAHAPAQDTASDPYAFSVQVAAGLPACAVDLHDDLPACYASPLDPLFARAQRIALADGAEMLVPCAEDHLRIVVLHFLRHGGWRPLWLCDIAALAEAAGPDFDWPLCLTDDTATQSWIEAALAAAATLLGGRIANVPPSACPPWMIETILKEWRAPYAARAMPASGSEFHAPWAALRAKWPNPIRAGFLSGAPVQSVKPLRSQLAFLAKDEIPRALARLRSRAWWRHLLRRTAGRPEAASAVTPPLPEGRHRV